MFDLINGIPVHPLVVHAVVVLLPLTILGTILIAVRPAWRVSYGPLVLAFAVVATALIPVATSSGEALEKHVGEPAYDHAEKGDQMIWFAIPLLVLVAALVFVARRAASAGETGSTLLPTVLAVLAVLAAVAAGVQVYRVGDSGAKAVWYYQVHSSASGGDTDGDAG
ncbi:DUF2231 domain-containing protein [Nocardioides acrostichi]|uniref:DUF2231 domain-containing protein n=1 Tax=Nocardioides acrostichi TaxID=2784339 RepID=A0A930Y875_9ACTN|nr:DUF2231 domain-containing protein [Nocardioides acrostichi]MBF4162771.1 hypothetical protein [Nocardioides acrostichi]